MFIAIKQHKTAASAKAFLAAVRRAASFKIRTILTDNGKEFTDRLFGSRSRQPTGEHEFDQLCHALGIEHRLTKLALAACAIALTTGCSDANVALRKLSKAADNFEVNRRIVFYNRITDTYLLSIEGICSKATMTQAPS